MPPWLWGSGPGQKVMAGAESLFLTHRKMSDSARSLGDTEGARASWRGRGGRWQRKAEGRGPVGSSQLLFSNFRVVPEFVGPPSLPHV